MQTIFSQVEVLRIGAGGSKITNVPPGAGAVIRYYGSGILTIVFYQRLEESYRKKSLLLF
jgi:hypothetical protein